MNMTDDGIRQLLANLVLVAMLATVIGGVLWKLTAKRRERERNRLFLERGMRGARRD